MKCNSYFLIVASVFGLVGFGCDLSESRYNDLSFDNASRFTVHVTPSTTEWTGFSLAPEERKSFSKIDHPDFSWQPIDDVELSVSSTDRKITFVDRGTEFTPPPTVIYVTNTVTEDSRR